MPQTDVQWLWFLFFSIGAVGGILSLVDRVLNVIDMLRMTRHFGASIKAMDDSNDPHHHTTSRP